MQPFVKTIHPRGVLSFAPDSEPLALSPLNILIGPNGSGKSNLIEIFELLKALPTDLAEVIRDGGGIGEWLWKGEDKSAARLAVGTTVSAELQVPGVEPLLRYILELGAAGPGLEVVDEAIEKADGSRTDAGNAYFYYRNGRPMLRYHNGAIRVTDLINADFFSQSEISLSPPGYDRRRSVLSQRKDPDLYPEVTAVGSSFGAILTYREWSFGRYVPLRQPQPTDLPSDAVLPDARNLGLILNAIEHSDTWPRLNAALSRFLPRFKRITTLIQGGTVKMSYMKTGSALPYQRRDCPTERFGLSRYWRSC
jgi:predicted ATPase